MKNRTLASKIALARWSIFWERLWQTGWRLLVVLAAGLVILATGVVERAPDAARFVVIGAIAAAFLYCLAGFRHVAWPSRAEAVRRVERETGLSHRAASAAADRLAEPQPGDAQTTLWAAHRERLLAQLTGLRAGWPRPHLSIHDPYALRFASGLAIVCALVVSQGYLGGSLTRATAGGGGGAPEVNAGADAWITPPSYTGKPPVLLTSAAMRAAIIRGEAIRVPVNSTLTVRISNADKPALDISPQAGGDSTQQELKVSGAIASADMKLVADSVVTARSGSAAIDSWTIAVIPDQAPSVTITGEPKGDPSGALAVQWAAEDDYGVSRITSDMQLSDLQNGELGLEGNGYFLFEAPELPVSLKQASPKSAKGKAVQDLTAHPWAGLSVDLTLEARDAAGNSAKSGVKTITLPERRFRMPLARALVEQRKALIANPDDTTEAQAMLRALITFPKGLVESSGATIGIATVTSRLRNSEGHDDIRVAISLLWDIALAIEDGTLSGARAELDALKKELEQALLDGAPPERIAELTQKLREAMNRYMREMAEENRRRMQRGEKPRQADPNARTVTPQELQKMLDQIERLGKNGSNDAARELLSELDEILRNLKPGMQAQNGQQNGEMSELMNELSELMRRQQKLMDDTGRMPGSQGDGGEMPEGMEPGERGQGQGQGEAQGLADQQQALERMLEELRNRMGQQGLGPPQSFGDAGRSMRGATDDLKQGDGRSAQGQQGNALDALRRGARDIARQLSEQGTGQTGNPGQHGEARGDERDPLDRPTATRGEDRGPDRDMLPGEIAVRRAREILDLLRGRANDPDRPRIEREYLDRLLKGLF